MSTPTSFNNSTSPILNESEIGLCKFRACLNFLDCSKMKTTRFVENEIYPSGVHFDSLIEEINSSHLEFTARHSTISSSKFHFFRDSKLEKAFLDHFAYLLCTDKQPENIAATTFLYTNNSSQGSLELVVAKNGAFSYGEKSFISSVEEDLKSISDGGVHSAKYLEPLTYLS